MSISKETTNSHSCSSGAATLAAMLVSTIAVGCARGADAPADGVLTEENGNVRRISDVEAKELCKTRFCEPNYIQTPPETVPSPAAALTPAPSVAAPATAAAAPSPSPLPSASPTRESSPSASPSVSAEPAPAVFAKLGAGQVVTDQLDYSRQLMGVPTAWQTTLGSPDVIVAVVDSGVDYTHPDLKDNIWVNEKEANGTAGADDDGDGLIDDVYGYNFFADRGNGSAEAKHGTHVAGIIGAELNGFGTAGISPNVKIMPLTFIGPDGQGNTLNAIKAINYAVDHGARIISASWGSPGKSTLLGNAVQRAIDHGVLFVAAAGNDANPNDTTPYYPAGYPGVIAVASSDNNDQLSSFSNYGKRSVMIAAPGSDILSTVPGGQWEYMSGTSMATPQVSGALALALSVQPDLTADQLKDKLCASSRKILLKSVQCGRMDVAALIQSLH